MTYRLGETLRDLDVEWCGGLVALWQAGYDAEVVERLAQYDLPAAAAFIEQVVWTWDAVGNALPGLRTALADWHRALDDRAASSAKRKRPLEFDKALAIAQRAEIPPLERRSEVVLVLRAWAFRKRLRPQMGLKEQLDMMIRDWILTVAVDVFPALEPADARQFEMALREWSRTVAEHAHPALEHAFNQQLERMSPAAAERIRATLGHAFMAQSEVALPDRPLRLAWIDPKTGAHHEQKGPS